MHALIEGIGNPSGVYQSGRIALDDHSGYRMTSTKVLLLGTLRIANEAGEVVITTRSVARLLGFLALYAVHGRTQPREVVADRLWPARPAREARSALNNTLYATYQKLGPSAHRYLAGDAQNLWLINVERDIDTFEQFAETDSIEAWQAALALYQGDLLSTIDDDWVDTFRHPLHTTAISLFERLCKTLIDQRQFMEALAWARRWVATDPLNEPAHCIIMSAYAQLDQPAAALRQYEHLRQLLLNEIGDEPLPETQALMRTIRTQSGHTIIGQALQLNMIQPTSIGNANIVRMAELVRIDVPLGRRITSDDRVFVQWTIQDAQQDAAIYQQYGEQALRQHRIKRLITEANQQGAAPTDQDLADALGVSRRTIEHDMAALQAQGLQLLTRRRSRTRDDIS